MVQLPRYVAFKSKLKPMHNYNGEILRYVNEASEIQTYLQYSGETVLSPYTKFEIEQANCDPSLINIRCCYNNKYWVSLSENNYTYLIVAGAKKPEEDKSKWNCTLFQPIYDNSHQAFRFRHVFTGYFVALWQVGFAEGKCLRAQHPFPSDWDLGDLNTIIDYEALVSIPKHVAFKGDNGCYLKASWSDSFGKLQFNTSDIGDPGVPMETFTTKDGSIRIKSEYVGKFWRRCNINGFIWAESTDDSDTDPNTLFLATQIDTNTIALRNLGNNNFIKRFSDSYLENGLCPLVKTIDQYSQFQIAEAVLSREIYNVRFRPSDARIYDQSLLVMATGNATNGTEVPNTVSLRLKYTDTKSKTWNASVSLKLGVKTKLQTKIPFIAKGQIELSAELSGAYQWGKTETESKDIETTFQVPVPPMTTVIVSLLATKGTCDVPYSYTQRDVLINGEIDTSDLDDGIYSGTSCYNFTYQTKKIPMLNELK